MRTTTLKTATFALAATLGFAACGGDEQSQHDAALAAGALVVVEEKKCRVRVLPL
jgi:hypothetical protein